MDKTSTYIQDLAELDYKVSVFGIDIVIGKGKTYFCKAEHFPNGHIRFDAGTTPAEAVEKAWNAICGGAE